MRARVQKWGNSLALRIPKSFAAETGLDQGSVVDVSIEDGRLVITPVAEPGYTLEGLLGQIGEHNLHPETDTGENLGREAW